MIAPLNRPRGAGLPRFARSVLARLLPAGERDEILGDLADEFAAVRAERGRLAAERWIWTQVLGSAPALIRREMWRGWTGFETRSDRMRPGGTMLASWIVDLRYAARRLRLRPMYTLLAVLTLALGVGGTAAVYSLVRGLLWNPLPFAGSERLAVFWNPGDWSEAEIVHMRDEPPGFERIAGWRPRDATLETGDGPTRLVPGIASSSELFDVLGVRPLIGPGFQSGDDRMGGEPVAVLSYGLWRELGGDRGIIGQPLRLDGTDRRVVGVMPAGFWFPDPRVRIWMSASLDPESRVGNYALIGRYAPGLEAGQMQPALARFTAMLGDRFTYTEQWDKTRNAALTPVRSFITSSLETPLMATVAALLVILLIACANVATLMLAQVEGRESEFAVRTALGADRGRLVQQIVIEALVVGLLAGIAGAGIAVATFGVLANALPLGALSEAVAIDWTTFVAAIAIALAAALAVALVPAFSLRSRELRGSIDRARTAGAGAGGSRLASGLVVAEVALAVLLAAGAALLVRSAGNLRAIQTGVDVGQIAVIDIVTPSQSAPADRRRIVHELNAAMRQIPGIEAAGTAHKIPLRGPGSSAGLVIEGRPEPEARTSYFRVVTPGYMEAMGIELRDGRGFTEADVLREDRVIVVNEKFVETYFPGESPLGRRIATGLGHWATVIGVVENVTEARLTDAMEPARYFLYEHSAWTPAEQSLVLRMRRGASPTQVLEVARAAIQRVAPSVAIQNTTTMAGVLDSSMGAVPQLMTMLTFLTLLALLLGALGIYGVVSHFVNRRKREWGIRIALGLAPRRVAAHVVRRGSVLVAGGVVVGLVGVVVLSRVISSLLYDVRGADPIALASASVVLLAVGVLAALVPARRASRVDPIMALREQ